MPSLDRLSRSLQDLITMVGDLRKHQVGFTSLHENLDNGIESIAKILAPRTEGGTPPSAKLRPTTSPPLARAG